MRKKETIFYLLICVSIGYLLYNYLFSEFNYGMMGHHYGYYDDFSWTNFYISRGLEIGAYLLIILSSVFLIKNKRSTHNSSLSILDNRLSRGEISIEEYSRIKRIINKK